MFKNRKRLATKVFSSILLSSMLTILTPLSVYAQSYYNGSIGYYFDPSANYRLNLMGPGISQMLYGWNSALPYLSVNGTYYILGSMNPVTFDESNIANGYTSKSYSAQAGVVASMKLSPINNFKYVKYEITLTNTNPYAVNAGFKERWDTMVDGNDRSPIEYLADGSGLRMYNASTGKQLTLKLRNTYNVTDVDELWAGDLNNAPTSTFDIPTMTLQPGSTYSSRDSALAFKWRERSIPAGQSVTFSVIAGTGAININPVQNTTSPTSGQMLAPGSNLNIQGTMSDSDGGNVGSMYMSYAIDDQPAIALPNVTDSSTSYNFNYQITLPSNLTLGNHTLKVWATDKEGGVSTVQNIPFTAIDNIAPTLTLTPSTTAWTNGDVSISVVGSDNSGVSQIQTPAGWINGSSTIYTVGANGTYNFAVKDISGNITNKSITISNIEKIAPTATSAVIQNQDENGYDVIVSGVSDNVGGSGVDRVQFPTWSNLNGQDDLLQDWMTNPYAKGTDLGGGTWKFHVYRSSHNNELGLYNTHVYVFDKAGNYKMVSGLQTTLVWNDNATLNSSYIPSTMEAGQQYTVYVTATNTGGKTWDSSNYKLGAINDSDPFTGNRQSFPSGTTVAPGQSYTFPITMTAPKIPGTYTTDWQMVHELVKWFGNSVSNTIVVSDNTKPTISYTNSSGSSWTKDPITLKITASDGGSGVKSIQTPDGNIVSVSTVDYIVTQNGNYTFNITDNSGNVLTQTISVTNIDKSAPLLSFSRDTDLITNKTVTITATATDSQSGVKNIILPDGTIINGSTANYTVSANGSYSFTVEDNLGNKATSSFVVSNIIPISTVSGTDRIEYKLDGTTIQDWTTYTAPINVVNEGITTITARAIDKAGNYSDTASSIVKLDRSKPINGNIQIIIK